MLALLREVRARYDDRYIIIDSPPPHLTAESKALAQFVDGIILVLKLGQTDRNLVSELVGKFQKEKSSAWLPTGSIDARLFFTVPGNIPNTAITVLVSGEGGSYKIGSGDVLEIVTWKEPDFSREAVLVRTDGLSASLAERCPGRRFDADTIEEIP
jgi:hypothetical protein